MASKLRQPRLERGPPRWLSVRLPHSPRDANGNPIQIPGPICLGGGRFYGVGLFAAI
ncbi:MAG: hypothetical protein ACLP6W_03100 [Bryobacteraceae bacterium]